VTDRRRDAEPGWTEAPVADQPSAPRPLIERIGLAAIALVLTLLFAGVSYAAFTGGEVFLAMMAGIGAVMTIWAAASSLPKG
jgi:hypothetical protein